MNAEGLCAEIHIGVHPDGFETMGAKIHTLLGGDTSLPAGDFEFTADRALSDLVARIENETAPSVSFVDARLVDRGALPIRSTHRLVVRARSTQDGIDWLAWGAADYVTPATSENEVRARLVRVLAEISAADARISSRNELDVLGIETSAFLRQLAHDLKNPLNGVLGYVDLVLLDYELPPQTRLDVESVRENAEQMLRVCSRIDARLELATRVEEES